MPARPHTREHMKREQEESIIVIKSKHVTNAAQTCRQPTTLPASRPPRKYILISLVVKVHLVKPSFSRGNPRLTLPLNHLPVNLYIIIW